jgi:hypothetical protein
LLFHCVCTSIFGVVQGNQIPPDLLRPFNNSWY